MTGTPPNDFPDSPPPPPPQPPSGDPAKKTDRELVAAALRAARPRTDTPGGDEPLPTPESFPGYEIVREIHRGGQGVVYQAIQKATKRKVALKVMHGGPFVGSKGRARFEREVAILAQLQHPNIVGVLDSGTSVGQAFYVMDYVPGQTLDAWMAGDPKLLAEILPLFAKICEAVNAAHLKGITHRDLKPSNIRIDHSGEPHILDFGLAKVVIGEVTEETQPQMMSMTGQFIGSLPWASPEQAEGAPGKVDLRTDVYSLGVILYQLLTGGKFPYEVIGNMRDVMENILRAEPARPSTIRRQVNDEVETIVLKSLQKERERRYQSAGELGRDIRRYLSGEPIEAMRDSGWYVIRKTLRKYQVPTTVAAVFLVLVIGFGIVSYVLYRNADDARERANKALDARNEALGVAKAEKARAEELNAAYARVTEAGRALRRRTFTDYYPRIESLVGATPAKEALLRDGLAYLEALRKDSSADPAFREELAEALEAVGRIEAGLYTARVGKTSDAEVHLREAVALGEALATEKPADAGRRIRLSRALLQLAQVERQAQRFEDALRTMQASLSHAEQGVTAAASSPDLLTEARTARANAHTITGELLIRIGQKLASFEQVDAKIKEGERHYDLAAAYWQERAAADATDAKAARLVLAFPDKRSAPMVFRGTALSVEARALADAGKKDEARAKYDAANTWYKDAAALSEKSAADMRALADRFKGDADILRSVCISLRGAGDALTRRGELEAEMATRFDEPGRRVRARTLQEHAFALLTDAVATARAAASTDGKNLDAQRLLGACLRALGSQKLALGRTFLADRAGTEAATDLLEDAYRAFDEARAQAELLVEMDPSNLHTTDLIVANLKMGEASMDQMRYVRALPLLERAVMLMETLPDEGGFGRSSAEYADAQRRITELRWKLAKPEE